MILWLCETSTSHTDELLTVWWWDLVPWEAAVPGSCWVPSSKFNHWVRKEKHSLTYNPWQIADPCIWGMRGSYYLCSHNSFLYKQQFFVLSLKKKVWKSEESSVSFLCVRSPFYRWLNSAMSGVNVTIV